jgi:hypothetical protein
MADHLASLSPDELAKWYRRLADFVSQQNQEACTKRQTCVGDPLAPELAPIRVNILSPGLIDTPAYNWMSEKEKQGFFKKMGGDLPVGRVGKPDEIAGKRSQGTASALLPGT